MSKRTVRNITPPIETSVIYRDGDEWIEIAQGRPGGSCSVFVHITQVEEFIGDLEDARREIEGGVQ